MRIAESAALDALQTASSNLGTNTASPVSTFQFEDANASGLSRRFFDW